MNPEPRVMLIDHGAREKLGFFTYKSKNFGI